MGFSCLYSLTLIYTNLCADHFSTHFEAFLLNLDRTVPLSPFLDETLPLSLNSRQVLTLAHSLLAQLCQCLSGA